MSTETFIALGLTLSISIASERLLQKFQCRQKSIEAFWQLSLSQIWGGSQPHISKITVDRCQVINRISIGKINTWHWGNSSFQVELKPGARHE